MGLDVGVEGEVGEGGVEGGGVVGVGVGGGGLGRGGGCMRRGGVVKGRMGGGVRAGEGGAMAILFKAKFDALEASVHLGQSERAEEESAELVG